MKAPSSSLRPAFVAWRRWLSSGAARVEHHLHAQAKIDALAALYREGGSAETLKHIARGRLPVRRRLELLVDPGTAFLELSVLAGHDMYGFPVPCGGIVTGLARINGRVCVVVANDPTVKGGTYFPVTGRKHMRAQDIAFQNRLPCVYLVDSGGG